MRERWERDDEQEDWRPPWLESIRPVWSLGGDAWKAVVRCWREQPCSGCGGVYSYISRQRRKVWGPDAAGAINGGARYTYELLIASGGKVAVRPCPYCGLCQPGMVGWWRFARHRAVLLALSVLAGMAVMAAWIDSHLWAWWASAGLVLFWCIAHLLIERGPGRGPEANLRWAEHLEKRGELCADHPFDGEREKRPPPSRSILRRARPYFLVGLFLAPVLTFAAEGLRLARGWQANEGCSPLVVGPDDEVKIIFPNQGTACIDGQWAGVAQVELLNEAYLGLTGTTLDVETSQTTSGSFGELNPNGRTSYPEFWVKVRSPDDSSLEGKTLRLRVRLDVAYPQAIGGVLVQKTTTRERTVELKVAGRGAGSTYFALSFGSLFGAGLAGACGLGLLMHAGRERELGPRGWGRPFPEMDRRHASPLPAGPAGPAPLPEVGPDDRIRPPGEHISEEERGPPDERYRPDR